MKSIQKARQRSDDGVRTLRNLAAKVFGSESSLIIGINGSYARREATDGSDIDLFYLLSGNSKLKKNNRKAFEDEVKEAGFKLPSEGGVFSEALRTEDLLSNIGGSEDNNASLTRRLLLLLEGEWLFNQVGFLKTRNDLLEKYVSDKTPEGKIALFLLNDIIRYWRTICVDYEYKTSDGKKPKGIRLVKLRFSRMFLVFGGIVAVAETYGLEPQKKLIRLEKLFSMDVLSRVESVIGRRSEKVIMLYSEFLDALDDKDKRNRLSSELYEEMPEFKDLRLKGREFKEELLSSLSGTYEVAHPIHKALLL